MYYKVLYPVSVFYYICGIDIDNNCGVDVLLIVDCWLFIMIVNLILNLHIAA